MREFNTSGPCDPALHYIVMRETLIAEGIEKVAKGVGGKKMSNTGLRTTDWQRVTDFGFHSADPLPSVHPGSKRRLSTCST